MLAESRALPNLQMQGMQFCIANIANKNCAFTDQTGLSVLLVTPL